MTPSFDFALLEPDVREMVEAAIVQAADVGDEAGREPADCFVVFATPTETTASAASDHEAPAITVMRVLSHFPPWDGYLELGRGLYGLVGARQAKSFAR